MSYLCYLFLHAESSHIAIVVYVQTFSGLFTDGCVIFWGNAIECPTM